MLGRRFIRSILLGPLLTVVSLFVISAMTSGQASALPKCFSPFTPVAQPGARIPRTGLAKNASSSCPDVPATTGWGSDFTKTNGGHIFLSSYYSNANGSPGSTLHTPNASMTLYSRTQPTTTQSLWVGVWYCSGGGAGINRVAVFKGQSFIGTGTQIVNIAPSEFTYSVADNMYYSPTIVASIINPVSNSIACKVSANVLTGAFVGLTPDPGFQSTATTGYPNRYNQNNWRTDKQKLGAPGQDNAGPIAFRVDMDSNVKLEYALSFKPYCNITVPTTIYLKAYDADSPAPGNPSGTNNGSLYEGSYALRMLVYEYDSAGNYVQTMNPTGHPEYMVGLGNDDFGQWGITVRPGYKYTWVWWNVGATNGLQVWMPFAESTGASDFACPPPQCPAGYTGVPPNCVLVGTVSCTLNAIATIEPGESYTPSVNLSYVGPPAAVTVTVTVTVNGVTRTFGPIGGAVPGNFNLNGVGVGPPIPFNTAGDFPVVTKSVSGTVNGVAYGPTTCGGATSVPVRAKPYLKTYGGDVWAGGGFGSGTCVSNAGVYAFAKTYDDGRGNITGYSGSSSQLGVMALLSIKEFYSASQRRTLNTQGKGLSLSNTAGDATYGGAFGGNGLCISDYYTDTQDSTLSQGNLGGNPAVGLNQYTRPANSTLAASAIIDVPLGSQSVVYVDGDVRINGNVTYASGAADRSQLPFFALIARGNIYIDASVTRLDGLYIAQPSNFASPTNGKIYTCAQSVNTLYSLAALYDACNTQLTVNGALIAHQVKFLRTRGSLFGSTIEEIPNFLTGAGTNASEVINYTPEMYLAPSPLKNSSNPGGSTSTGSYDAIFSLPPVY